MTDSLGGFVRARLDEREQTLRAMAEAAPDGREAEALSEMLAGIAAQRQIVDAYERAQAIARDHPRDRLAEGEALGLRVAVAWLAGVYFGHPGYPQAWTDAAGTPEGTR